MKIAGLVGSVRKDSYNNQIAGYLKKRYAEPLEIEYLNIKELPYFDQDQENSPPEIAKKFKESVAGADACLIVTPEYNHSVPGVLKNAIDWLSRGEKVIVGKPVLIIGASTGFLGTVRCQIHLRQILASPGLAAKVLPGNEVFIGMVHEKLDERGNLIDVSTINFIDTVIENFKIFVEETNRDHSKKVVQN